MNQHTARRRPVFLLAILLTMLVVWTPGALYAQSPTGSPATAVPAGATVPLFWYLLAAAVALLVPIGLVLIGVTGLEPTRAWHAALGAVGAIGLAGLAYWAVGFALQFGGIGLAYLRPELRGLVWEWSPLPADWGTGWGVAGLSGWFLSGGDLTAMAYALFLSHLPWVFTAALLPVLALRGRAPASATLLLALLLGGVIYPLAGNWVQGGGWLAALGRNLSLGHGFVDAGGAGTVFLLAAAFALAAVAVWPSPRQAGAEQRLPPPTDYAPRPTGAAGLPPTFQPLLTVIGSLFVLAGVTGWLWANPLQVETLSDLALLRGSVNVVLAAAGGSLVPLLYTWFVAGRSDPTLTGRGLAAGVVAGLAVGPFVAPSAALALGVAAGATVPFVSYIVDHLLHLDDATGVIVTSGLPALLGLLGLGVLADGAAGAGWQLQGAGGYLGVAGQGVSGLFVAGGFQPDFPGQLQAQVIGVVALVLWGFLSGLVVCAPLALLFHNLQRSEDQPPLPAGQAASHGGQTGLHAPPHAPHAGSHALPSGSHSAPLLDPDLGKAEAAHPSRT
jgi:Amt family ammonium transporter